MQRRRGSLAPVDMPLGERAEQYSVAISVGGDALEYSCAVPAMVVPASDLLVLGAGIATITVKQVGDWGASRPAQIQITLV